MSRSNPVAGRRSLLVAALPLFAPRARSQAGWPSKPIKIVLPYPPGGGAEPILRNIGNAVAARLGQPVVVEFKPGANGAIGARAVADAPPDGYTLLFVPAPPVVHNKLLYKNLSYDPQRDLVPLGRVGESPMLIIVNAAKVPARNLQQLVSFARERPGMVKAAHVGAGSMAHLTSVLFEREGKVKLNLVPYGTAQRLNDLLSGEIDMIIDLPAAYLPHIETGRLAAIAVMTQRRFPGMPNVPTAVEGGFPRMLAEGWYGIYGPRGMPREAIDRFNQAMTDYLRTPAAQQQMLQYALVTTPSTPEGHAQYLAQEYEKWGPLIRDAKIAL